MQGDEGSLPKLLLQRGSVSCWHHFTSRPGAGLAKQILQPPSASSEHAFRYSLQAPSLPCQSGTTGGKSTARRL